MEPVNRTCWTNGKVGKNIGHLSAEGKVSQDLFLALQLSLLAKLCLFLFFIAVLPLHHPLGIHPLGVRKGQCQLLTHPLCQSKLSNTTWLTASGAVKLQQLILLLLKQLELECASTTDVILIANDSGCVTNVLHSKSSFNALFRHKDTLKGELHCQLCEAVYLC